MAIGQWPALSVCYRPSTTHPGQGSCLVGEGEGSKTSAWVITDVRVEFEEANLMSRLCVFGWDCCKAASSLTSPKWRMLDML